MRAIAHRSGATEFPVDDFDLIVEQTTGPLGVPLRVNELALSSQGATVDLEGEWVESVLAGYRHRAINGRDLHVEIVIRGYLAPFGHPASLTTISERELRGDESGDLTASLTADTYLAISSPTVTYPADTSIFMPHEGRRLPFSAVVAEDKGRGPVDREHIVMPNGSRLSLDKACLLTRADSDLQISYTATDRAGHDGVTFELPAVFVADTKEAYEANDSVGGSDTVLAKLATWYADAAEDSRRDLQLGGQSVGWADPSPRGGSGSVQTTNRIRISLDRPDTGATIPADVSATLEDLRRPAFYPGVAAAWIVDQASTTTLGGDPPETEVTLAQRWLDFGIGAANVDLGYLDLVAPTVVLPTTDALGMLAASLNVGTFGQLLGAGFKLPELGGGAWMWDALEALGGVGGEGLPKLLGSLELPDLIPPIDVGDSAAASQLPKLNVEPQFDHPDVPEIPTGVCFHFTWEPKVQSFPKDSDSPTFVADEQTHVLLALTSCVPEVTTTFTAALERFTVQLPPEIAVVAIDFEHVTYSNVNGSSSIEAKVADWRFIGALSWLEPLKDLLAGLLDNGTPTFDGGIFIDYGIPVPGFKLGVLGVSGLRVDLALDLPDTGASAVALDVGQPRRSVPDHDHGVRRRRLVRARGRRQADRAHRRRPGGDVRAGGRRVPRRRRPVGVARDVHRVRPHRAVPRGGGDVRRLRHAPRQPAVHRHRRGVRRRHRVARVQRQLQGAPRLRRGHRRSVVSSASTTSPATSPSKCRSVTLRSRPRRRSPPRGAHRSAAAAAPGAGRRRCRGPVVRRSLHEAPVDQLLRRVRGLRSHDA